MKILIDGRWLGRTGLGRYTAELLRELQEIDTEHDYVVLMLPEQYANWQPTNPRFTKAVTNTEVYTFGEQTKLAREIKALKPDLVHFMYFNLPMAYRGKFVVTVHDLTLLNFKNLRGSGVKKVIYEAKYNAMKLVLSSAVKHAAHIITATEYVKGALVDYYGTNRNKVTVTYEAVGSELKLRDKISVTPLAAGKALEFAGSIERLKLKGRFIMYAGNYYPYKNIRLLVDGFAKSKFCTNGGSLVLTGKPEHFQNLIRDYAKELKLEDQIIFAGFVSDEELAGLFKQAALYVFPSLSEGFGLPGLEAMAHGTPVLAASASCLPEVYGDAAVYFDPHDADDLSNKIDQLLADPDRLAELSAAGVKQAAGYSWRRTAEQTLAVYNTALKSK